MPEQFRIHVERVEKHLFRLAKMSEMVDKIPTLGMDMAFFVVIVSNTFTSPEFSKRVSASKVLLRKGSGSLA